MTLKLRPYQEAGRDFLASRKHALLADQMRVGKTPQAILAADKVNAKRVLVVCPAIATAQWAAEWAGWSPERLPAEVVTSTPPGFKNGVAVMSYDRAGRHNAALTQAAPWDVLIVDEAHFAKSPTAQRTQLIYAKGGLGWNAKRIWALTGTPAPNHAGELWPMLRAFGAVDRSYGAFVRHYCYYDEVKQRVWGNRADRLGELREVIAPFYLRRTRAQVAPDVPAVQFNLLAVDPVKGADLPSTDLGRISELDRVAVALAKVPALVKEIEFNIQIAKNYEQTVVFGYHREPLRLLRDTLVGRGISAEEINGSTPGAMRESRQDRFRRGDVSVLCAQIIAAGTAIDLSAASQGYFLELDWVPGNNEQAASRLVNLNTGFPVIIDVVNWPGTADDAVQRTLLRKQKNAVFTGN